MHFKPFELVQYIVEAGFGLAISLYFILTVIKISMNDIRKDGIEQDHLRYLRSDEREAKRKELGLNRY